jgi:shikimate dehydrogenase
MSASPPADRYCVVGQPVAHSRSPWIHARFAQLTGEPVVYDKLAPPADGFAAAVRDFRAAGGRGCNVTLPFKFEAFALATTLSERARLAGACNTLRFERDGGVHGDNTDGAGLVRDIATAGAAVTGARVLLVGAGGAAAGVLGPLLQAQPSQLLVANRTAARAADLVRSHAALAALRHVPLQAGSLDAISGRFDLVVNATASSLGGGAVPVPAGVLAPGALAYDMMYGPAAQGFLDWARHQGAQARDGLGMLVEQAAESFHVWRGVRPPTAPVLAELRAMLDA